MLILIVCGGESMPQKKVALECTKCGAHNYTITANPQRQERLELKKFCKHIRARRARFSKKICRSAHKSPRKT